MNSALRAGLLMVAFQAAACSSAGGTTGTSGAGAGGNSSAGNGASSGGSAGGLATATSGGMTTATSGGMATSGSGGLASAGSGGIATSGSTSGGDTSAGTGTTGAGGDATMVEPQLPAITDACPTFATGTVTVGGLSGISLQVGPKQQGTGSLVFYWHGTGSSANEVNLLIPAAVRQEILAQGGILVSFQGSLGTGGDCSGTATFSKDDFKVADQIAACAVKDYAIDPRRIYTTGCSAGGLQAGCMGAARSSYVAAVVPNSGGEIAKLPIQDPKHVPSVMTMHGGATDKVVVSFATTSAAYDAQMSAAGAFVVNCNHDGGHCQAPAALYTAGWEFMKAHPFGVAPEPYSSALPASFPSYCAEY